MIKRDMTIWTKESLLFHVAKVGAVYRKDKHGDPYVFFKTTAEIGKALEGCWGGHYGEEEEHHELYNRNMYRVYKDEARAFIEDLLPLLEIHDTYRYGFASDLVR